jgi:hypothetical protein
MRRSIAFLLLLLVVLPVGVPVASAAGSAVEVDVGKLDARIATAQRRVDRWYERIERWYERIDRAVVLVERLEAAAVEAQPMDAAVLRRTTPRRQQPDFLLAEARHDLRATLTDPWARGVQAELDTWSAFLAELVHARERAVRPVPDEREERDPAPAIAPGQPVSYEAWAGAFLRRIDAPGCAENLLIVVTWETAESTVAAFNPLATTRDMPGATDMNTVGVKHYTSLDQGLDASRDTLLQGAESYGYDAIVDSLGACSPAEVTARAINASAWCRGCVGGAYITGLLPIVRASYTEHAARLVSSSPT